MSVNGGAVLWREISLTLFGKLLFLAVGNNNLFGCLR